jgi:hypothetical protein
MHKPPAVIRALPPCRDAAADERTLAAVLAQGDCCSQFCSTCNTLVTNFSSSAHSSHDLVIIGNVFAPSRSLPNLAVDEESAQYALLPVLPSTCCDMLRMYFFSLGALDHLLRIIKHSGASAVVCIGCPSVHEALVDSGKHSVSQVSFLCICCFTRPMLPQTLLDMDNRFGAFFPRSFYLYNMLTGMAMLPGQQAAVRAALQRCDLIIVDPPFSAPLQALAETLLHIQRSNAAVKILLLLPYYEQQHVTRAMPHLHMLDYRVMYSHKNFNGASTPVRIFTNIPLTKVPSPQEAGYKLCLDCNDWMYQTNSHCKHCNRCTSVGGVPRRHCFECNACVKLGSLHCELCASCHPNRTPCPSASRCTVCASTSHRRHACPLFKEIVDTALRPWVIQAPLQRDAASKVASHTRYVRGVSSAVSKRPAVFIFAHTRSPVALLKYRWRSRRSRLEPQA